ncbi:MAG: transposase, partial [Mangrovibacterium sp.]
LKTDLDLRPIYHKSDEATQTHLQLGLLSYWLVNTIRYKLKNQNIRDSWLEVKRKMNTQKCVTTTMKNDKGEIISVRKCSVPTTDVKRIYDALGYKQAPFTKKKSVVHRKENQKNE